MNQRAWLTDRKIPNDISVLLSHPIGRLHWLERSLLMAEFSRLAYFSPDHVLAIANKAGINSVEFVDRDGAQAYVFVNDYDMVVVARGTEPNQWDDIRADANAWSVLVEIGRVHAGFNGEVDHLWPGIEQIIRDNQRPTYFTGHSLGAAMSMVCAARCKASALVAQPEGLYTFGSPRVGNRRYNQAANLRHYRWVNNNDIVTRVPPRWMGYRHSGFELYLDHKGRLRRIFSWARSKDRFLGLISSLKKRRLDYFSDHSMIDYMIAIQGLVDALHGGRRFPDPAQKVLPIKRILNRVSGKKPASP